MKKLTTFIAICTACIIGASALAQGKPGGDDTLDKKAARDLITAHGQEYRNCYDDAITGEARVRARITLDSKGQLSHTEDVTGEVDSAALSACMSGVFKKMDAKPVNRGNVTVSFPFNFSE